MDIFDLFVKITADASEYDKALDGAKSKASGVGDTIGKFIGGAGKLAAAGIGVATAAIGAMGMQSLNAYKNYEQLVGGVNKLYGNMGMTLEEYAENQGQSVNEVRDEWQKLENAQTMVLDNAKEAYKTVGMSANQYMEVATSFSAALINDLGDQEAAAMRTDLAMRAIGDNVNTFGSSMDSVQNAFMGFAKQNYTMLDNLKLGYGGTKQEMARLVEDANEYAQANGMAADLTMDSFADIVTAIDLIQQKQGIAGTTAREAATTIEGSLNMTKGAWENLVAGFANPDADLGKLMNDLVESATTAFKNILPAAQQALTGITQFITSIAPIIADNLPTLVNTVLPLAVDAFTAIIQAVAQAVPQVLPTLFNALMDIGSAFAEIALNLAQQAADALQSFDWAGAAQNLVSWIMGVFNSDTFQGLAEAGISIVTSIGNGIITAAPILLDGALQIVTKIGEGISSSTTGLLDAAINLITDFSGYLAENAGSLLTGGLNIILGLVEGILAAIPTLIEQAPVIIENLITAISAGQSSLAAAGVKLIGDIVIGIVEAIPALIANFPAILKMIVDVFAAFNPISLGITLIKDIANGVVQYAPEFVSKLKAAGEEGLKKLKETDWIKAGIELITNLIKGLDSLKNQVWEKMKEIGNKAMEIWKKIDWLSLGTHLVEGIWNGISGGYEWIKGMITGWVGDVLSFIKNLFGIHSPSTVMRDLIGINLVKGIAVGIENGTPIVEDAMSDIEDLVTNPIVANSTLAVSSSGSSGSMEDLLSAEGEGSYDMLADAIVNAFLRANVTVEYDNREFGRLVRKMVAT